MLSCKDTYIDNGNWEVCPTLAAASIYSLYFDCEVCTFWRIRARYTLYCGVSLAIHIENLGGS